MTASYTPLVPVGDALYALLATDPTLSAMATGGVHSDIPQNPLFPLVWFEVLELLQHGGFSTKPGAGALPELEVRIHVYQGHYGTMRDAQIVMQRVLALLADPPTVDGYGRVGIFHERTIPLTPEELNGVKVHELVSIHRLYVEEAA